MKILDIHTHHLPSTPGQAIVNVNPTDFTPQPGHYYSVGFHPWHLLPDHSEDWEKLNNIATHPQVLAIGESGLDKVAEVSLSLQIVAFERQLLLASHVRKPLIIHCVRSYNEIMEFKKDFNPQNPWIIHGFRGKKELALQLTNQGIYLSFGYKYQEDALRAVPPDRLFFETDESRMDIYHIYEQAASHLYLSVNELTTQVQQNINNLFFDNKSCLFK